MKEMLRSTGGILRCRDRAQRKLVRLMDARVGRVECAEMQHSPSRATNPESLRVQRDFEFRERLREDVCSHSLHGAVFDIDLPVRYGLSNEVKTYVDVFRASVIIIISREMECGLIIAVEGGGSGMGPE